MPLRPLPCALLSVLCLLPACEGDRLGRPTGSTGLDTPGTCAGTYTGPVLVSEARVTCLSDTRVRLHVAADGWTSGARLFSQETGTGSTRRAATGQTGTTADTGTTGTTDTGGTTPPPVVQWADEHTLETFKFSPCQEWDLLGRELQTGVDPADWQVDRSTAFSCATDGNGAWIHHGDPEDGGVMTYVARVYDLDGVFADCMIFGHDPQGLLEDRYPRVLDPEAEEELAACVSGTYTPPPSG